MQRSFPRHLDALTPLYEFAEEMMEAHDIAEGIRFPVHLAMEELFVNMVKYNPDISTDIEVDVSLQVNQEVRVSLVDDGGVEFDVTAARPIDIDAPLEDRIPGGLGIHLIQSLVDTV
jgi:serine/threonine-protein kinase RsbW